MLKSRDKKRRLSWWWLVLAAAIGLAVYAAIPKPIEVRTAPVTKGVLKLSLSSTGVVEGELSDLSPRITAAITKLYAQEGQRVSRGQRLAVLEDSDVRAEVARLEAAALAAEEEIAARKRSASAETAQLNAAAARARAVLQSARARLKELETGSRKEDIEAQRAVVAEAEAREADARSRHRRAEELFKSGAISAEARDTSGATHKAASAALQAQRQQLQRLEAGPRRETLAAARAEVGAAEAALKEANAALGLSGAREKEISAAEARLSEARAGLEGAKAQLTYTVIRSPVNGVVARKHKEVGEIATPLDPVYSVADLGSIWVIAEVDEADAAAVAEGQSVKITLDAYPGRSVEGTVVRLSPVAEPKDVGRVRAKIVRARIHVEESTIPLRPGIEVNITGYVPAGHPTLLVPNDAVVRVGDKDTVFVIREGRAHSTSVKVGQSNFDDTQVHSGLKRGERVAITRLDDLSDGVRIRVRN